MNSLSGTRIGKSILKPSSFVIDAFTLTCAPPGLYIVHMKQITASEARSNWFRILDEVASGEVVVIQRRGKRFVLRQEKSQQRAGARAPDYRKLLRVKRPDRADQWRWDAGGVERKQTK